MMKVPFQIPFLLVYNIFVFSIVAVGQVKDTANIYLIGGQSNAAGWDMLTSTVPSAPYRGLHTNIKIIDSTGFVNLNVTPAETRTNQFPITRPTWGWDIIMYEEISLRTSKIVYVAKSATGTTSMYNYWHPDSAGKGKDNIKWVINKAITEIKALGKIPKFRTFYWYQGESDMNIPDALHLTFGANTIAFFDSIRTITGDPDLPIVFLRPSGTAANYIYRTQVRATIDSIGIVYPNCRIYDVDNYDIAGIHLTESGYIQLGIDLAKTAIIVSTHINLQTDNLLFKIYPSPFSKQATINLPVNDKYTLTITDMQGRQVKQYSSLTGEKVEITSEGMGSGLYFYTLTNKENDLVYKGKIIVNK